MNTNTATTAPATALAVTTSPASMTAIQVCDKSAALAELGKTYARSGFFGAISESAATAAVINCFTEGLSPVQYKAKYHTMEDGTTAIRSDFYQREFRRLGGRWHFNEWTKDVCDITFTFEGETIRGITTLQEFIDNGIAKGKNGLKVNWARFSKEMLKARCMATYIRALCPEAMGGMYDAMELDEGDHAPAAPAAPASAPIYPAPAPAPAPVDPAICPCGKQKGKRWEDIDTATIEAILAFDRTKVPSVTDAHREAAMDVLRDRAEAEPTTIAAEATVVTEGAEGAGESETETK